MQLTMYLEEWIFLPTAPLTPFYQTWKKGLNQEVVMNRTTSLVKNVFYYGNC